MSFTFLNKRLALAAFCMTLISGAATAATVTLNFAGTINASTTSGFTGPTGIQVGNSYTLAVSLDNTTPLTGIFQNGATGVYQQAITNIALNVGGFNYALRVQPYASSGPNHTAIINNLNGTSDHAGFFAPLIGPNQGGQTVGYFGLNLGFAPGSTLSGNTLAMLPTIANTPVSAWASTAFSLRFGPNPGAATAAFSGGVNSVSLAPVPLPATFGILALGLAALGGLRRKSRSKATV